MSISFPKTEEETIRFWREVDAFQTQLRLTEGCPRFTFYDGPPFGMMALIRSLLSRNMLTSLQLLVQISLLVVRLASPNLPQVFPIMAISWPPPSRTLSPDTGP